MANDLHGQRPMKVGTDDEINEKDAAILPFPVKHFLGVNFRQISRHLGFPEGSFKLF